MNLIDVTKQFATDEQCIDYLEKMRWPEGIRCVTCGNDKVSVINRHSDSKNKRTRIYQCLESTCKQQFTATAGTIFHDSHLPLHKWFMAIALFLNAKKGLSAKQLERDLGVSYRTAWYLAHRIRKAMVDGEINLSGTVEIDETYVGGKNHGKGVYYGKQHKQVVMGAIERGGKLRYKHVENAKIATIRKFVDETISGETKRIMTDEHPIYPFAVGNLSATHETIRHKYGQYVKGDVYTNTIESAFSLLKRGIIGSFHRVSIKHLHRYLSEFEYRFNNRKNPLSFEETVRRLTENSQLEYRKLIN